MLGPPGYPVLMLSGEHNFIKQVKVEHYKHGVQVGDGMTLGRCIETATTYVVLSNERKGPTKWQAQLQRCDFVAVAGEVFYKRESE